MNTPYEPPQSGHPPQPPQGGHPPQPPQSGYPPQPPQGGYAPQQPPYGAPPSGYPPPYGYGYPRKSKAPMWIGIGVGVVAVLGLAFHFVFVDNAWMDPAPSYRAPLTPAQKEAYSYVPSARGGAPAAATDIAGRWCSGGTYVQFDANGGLYDSRARTWGNWQEVSPGNVNMTFGTTTVAVNYRVSGNVLTISAPGAGEQPLTRC